MVEHEKGRHWLSSYAVNVAHLLTTFGLAAGLFMYAVNQHERLTRVEERGVIMEARMDREINRTARDLALIRESQQQMRESQQRLEDRLERWMER